MNLLSLSIWSWWIGTMEKASDGNCVTDKTAALKMKFSTIMVQSIIAVRCSRLIQWPFKLVHLGLNIWKFAVITAHDFYLKDDFISEKFILKQKRWKIGFCIFFLKAERKGESENMDAIFSGLLADNLVSKNICGNRKRSLIKTAYKMIRNLKNYEFYCSYATRGIWHNIAKYSIVFSKPKDHRLFWMLSLGIIHDKVWRWILNTSLHIIN